MKKLKKILGCTALAILVCVELFLFSIYYGVINSSLWRLQLQYHESIESQKFAVDVVSIMMCQLREFLLLKALELAD